MYSKIASENNGDNQRREPKEEKPNLIENKCDSPIVKPHLKTVNFNLYI